MRNTGCRQPPLTPNKLTRWADKPPASPSIFLSIIHAVIRVMLISMREFRGNHLPLRSGALTYTILLSLVPMLAMSTAVIKGLGGDSKLRQVVYSYVDTLENPKIVRDDARNNPPTVTLQLPPTVDPEQTVSNLTEHIHSAVEKIFAYVDRTNFATLGTIGVIGIFFSVILVLSTIEMAMNSIWHVSSGRSLLRKITDYLTLIILFPLSINIGFAASAILKYPTWLDKMETLVPVIWIQGVLFKLVPVFFITLTLFVTYIFFPNTRVKSGPAMIGALIAGSLWVSAQNLYFHLQIGVANYNAIYGSFATLPLFLIWLFIGWLFILTGAQIAFGVQNRNRYQLIPKAVTPVQLLGAGFDIITLVYQSFNQRMALTRDTLTRQLSEYDPSLITHATDLLIAANLLSRNEHHELLPTSPAEMTDPKMIIPAILGSTTPDTPGGHQSIQLIHHSSQA